MRKSFFYLPIYALALFLTIGFYDGAEQKNKTAQNSKEDHCVSCHKENDMMPKGFSENDVHRHAELSCSGCHGGDPSSDDESIAMSPSKGYRGVPKKKDIPQFCGKCHSNINIMRVYQPRIATDQVSQFYTSMHGKKLLQGDVNVADCTSCHTAHNILPAKDPRSTVYALNVPPTCNKCHGDKELMKKYNLPSNQLEEYSKSVHGNELLNKKDIGAPACNDCHGNHGAMPPGLTSVSYVCGMCHINNLQYFNATKMARAFEKQDFHGCEQCHGNHGVQKPSDNMVGVGKESICVDCHNEGDKGYATAKSIKISLDKLSDLYNLAETKLNEVHQKGMNEVEISFLLQDAKQDLIQSRTLVHTFDTVKVNSKTKDGVAIASNALAMAEKQINDYYTRRNGFLAATLAFLLLVVALYFKIKDIGKKNS